MLNIENTTTDARLRALRNEAAKAQEASDAEFLANNRSNLAVDRELTNWACLFHQAATDLLLIIQHPELRLELMGFAHRNASPALSLLGECIADEQPRDEGVSADDD